MMLQRKLIFTLVGLLLVFPLMTVSAQEQAPSDCQETYTVQAGDWLSKIAQKYYGDPLAYDLIVLSNNSVSDDTYTDIEDPNIIEPGWVLCIPAHEGDGKETMNASENTPSQPAISPGLIGTAWLLTELNAQPVLDEPAVTATFSDDGQLSGSSGCNTYSTGYERSPDDNSMTVNPAIAATMMACPEPIMQQEQAYLIALGTTTAYRIEGDELTLLDSNGNAVAVFSALVPVELAGSSWRVLSYNNGKQAVVSVIIDTEMTADFGTDGSLTGSSGCNNYMTTYQTNGENISIAPAASTRMACAEPEGIMEQETAYLAALTTAGYL
jgi:heat shock protein HslJ